jgi:hypothetical protein
MNKKADEDLNKLFQLLEEIVHSPVGQVLQRNSNDEVRRKKFREIMRLSPERPLTQQLTDVTDFDHTNDEIDVFANLAGCCESVVLEKLDRSGRLVAGLTWEEVGRFANETRRCYFEGIASGQKFAEANHRIIRSLISVKSVPIGIDFAKVLGVARDVEQKGNDGIAWLDGFWSGAQREVVDYQ